MAKPVRVFVSCGSGLVTSALIEAELNEIAEDNNLKIKISKIGMTAINSWLDEADVLVCTGQYSEDTRGVPCLTGNPLLSGFGRDEFEKEFIEVVKRISAE